METTKVKIRTFLARFFRGYDLTDDEDIFAAGFVNSMFAMQLVLFIEQEFGIQVGNEDLDLDNFRTIEAMTHFIGRKRTALAA